MKIVKIHGNRLDRTIVFCSDVGKFYVYDGNANLRLPRSNRFEGYIVKANKELGTIIKKYRNTKERNILHKHQIRDIRRRQKLAR